MKKIFLYSLAICVFIDLLCIVDSLNKENKNIKSQLEKSEKRYTLLREEKIKIESDNHWLWEMYYNNVSHYEGEYYE